MRVCHIVPSLEERHGGPSKSVRALANAQARSGATVELLSTLEHPVPPSTPDSDAATVRIFRRDAPTWLCPSRALAAHLAATDSAVLHYHSLWLRLLHYAHESSRQKQLPLVIAPRGMMSDWAWNHHRRRKLLVHRFIHPGALAGATGWHATSEEEAADIRRRGFLQPVCVAPNGVEIPSFADLAAARNHWLQLVPAAAHRPVALFYSRFHPKKRLRELVALWTSTNTGDWVLLLAGLPESYSVAEVQSWVTAAGAEQRIIVHDSTGHPPPYAVASLLVLPTHSENFGLVIAESLAAGVPVLTTDTTPWRDLPRRSAGWCVAWDAFPDALEKALAIEKTVLADMGGQGRTWVTTAFTWERSARLLQDFYRHLTHG